MTHKPTVPVCFLKEETNGMGCFVLHPPCMLSVFAASSSTIPKLLVGLVSVFHHFTSAHPGVSVQAKPRSPPHPGFRTLVNHPSPKRNCYCSQGPWGRSGPLALVSREGSFAFLCFPPARPAVRGASSLVPV